MAVSENSILGSTAQRLIGIAVLLVACSSAQAQVTAQSSATEKPGEQSSEHVPRVPGVSTLFRGFNAGFTYSRVHSSAVGWYQVATPAINYTFSPHYSADVSTPIYLHRQVTNLNISQQSPDRLVLDTADTGDTLLGFHASFYPRQMEDTATVSMTAPSGNRNEGLGTGRVTVDFDNFTERYIKQMGLLLDLGIGDSSSVVNTLLTQNYSSLGKLAHFQTGAVVWINHRYSIRSVAYEQLPFGSQTVYTTVAQSEYSKTNQPGSGQGSNATTNVVTSTGASEDNGFTTSVGIPLTSNLILSGYYDRSLRQHLDTFSVGMTCVVRGTPIVKHLSMIDRALREAAKGNDETR
jgi:hypothetical protein